MFLFRILVAFVWFSKREGVKLFLFCHFKTKYSLLTEINLAFWKNSPTPFLSVLALVGKLLLLFQGNLILSRERLEGLVKGMWSDALLPGLYQPGYFCLPLILLAFQLDPCPPESFLVCGYHSAEKPEEGVSPLPPGRVCTGVNDGPLCPNRRDRKLLVSQEVTDPQTLVASLGPGLWRMSCFHFWGYIKRIKFLFTRFFFSPQSSLLLSFLF